MESKSHFLVSAVVGGLVAAALGASVRDGAVIVLASAVLGVGIDFDHFVIARLRSGSWRAAAHVLRNPAVVLTDQGAIFEEGEVGKLPRLLSHTVLSGVLVAALAPVTAVGALVAGLVLYFHVLCDLLRDTYQLYLSDTRERLPRP